MTPKVIYEDLGLIDFKEAWDYQTRLFDDTIALKMANRRDENNKKTTSNYLLFCEHPHVFTLGKSGKETHLLLN